MTILGNTMLQNDQLESGIKLLCEEFCKHNQIFPEDYERFEVKRGLRNADGSGVVAGVTLICNVHGFVISEGEKSPMPGELVYRGIDVNDIVQDCLDHERYGFEETVWLLLFGSLPTKKQLELFNNVIAELREMPDAFIDDMIIKAPSRDIMNKLARSVLAMYSYDDKPEDMSLENLMLQSVSLIARMPSIMVSAYQVKRRAYDNKSMYFHKPRKELTIAQNVLRMLRADKRFTEEESRLLDLCLILHAEHGGGNNSTFATRVLTSTGTDTYSAIAAGIGSLKGPKHGGANIKVSEMLSCLQEEIGESPDEGTVKDYLYKLSRKEAGDKTGLIYGMGHAIYTISDPRALILREQARQHAQGTKFENEFKILEAIERLAPEILFETKKSMSCANVDLYSGLIYKMLNIPQDLYTPLFAISRTPGWCAHRIEEHLFGNRIMRPAYKAIAQRRPYIPIEER